MQVLYLRQPGRLKKGKSVQPDNSFLADRLRPCNMSRAKCRDISISPRPGNRLCGCGLKCFPLFLVRLPTPLLIGLRGAKHQTPLEDGFEWNENIFPTGKTPGGTPLF